MPAPPAAVGSPGARSPQPGTAGAVAAPPALPEPPASSCSAAGPGSLCHQLPPALAPCEGLGASRRIRRGRGGPSARAGSREAQPGRVLVPGRDFCSPASQLDPDLMKAPEVLLPGEGNGLGSVPVLEGIKKGQAGREQGGQHGPREHQGGAEPLTFGNRAGWLGASPVPIRGWRRGRK